MSFGFIDPFLDPDFSAVTGGASGSVVSVAPPRGRTSVHVSTGAFRRNPNGGLDQIHVEDPDRPGRWLWVDAIWDPVRDWMVAVDPKYRPPGNDYALANMFVKNFAETAGPGAIAVNGEGVQPNSGGELPLIVAVLIGLYLFTS